MTTTHGIATQIMGWKEEPDNDSLLDYTVGNFVITDDGELCIPATGRKIDGYIIFDPANNPAHATMVWDKVLELGWKVEFQTQGEGIITCRIDHHYETDSFGGGDITWMMALYEAAEAYLNRKDKNAD